MRSVGGARRSYVQNLGDLGLEAPAVALAGVVCGAMVVGGFLGAATGLAASVVASPANDCVDRDGDCGDGHRRGSARHARRALRGPPISP